MSDRSRTGYVAPGTQIFADDMADTLRRYPEIAILLTVAIGFAIGGVNLDKRGLGNVAGVLFTGVLIRQVGITISVDVKSVFLMFL